VLAALELGVMQRIAGGEALLPGQPLRLAARAGCAPRVEDCRRNLEWRKSPAELFAGALDLFGAKRRAVGGSLAGLGRRAEADGGAAGDERRPLGFFRRFERCGDGYAWPSISVAAQPADSKRFTWSTLSDSDVGPSMEMPLSS